MPELHNILQENATPSSASAFTSSSLPTVGSTFARPGSLRAKTCRSVTCLHLVVATLASFAAIAVLISLCSRAFERRALQGIQSRTLASPQDTDDSIDICGDSGDSEEQQQRTIPQPANSPVRGIMSLPIKKRFLAQAVESGTGGDWRTPYQQTQQQDEFLDDRVTTPFGFVPPEAVPRPEQLGPQQLPLSPPQRSGEKRTPTEIDAATGLLNLHSSEDAADPRVDERQSINSQVRQLQQQIASMQRKLDRLQKKLHRRRQSRRHQKAHFQQQHQLGLYQQERPMFWQVPFREDQGRHQLLLRANALHHLPHRGQQQQMMQQEGTQKAKQQEQQMVPEADRTRILKRKQQDVQQARQPEQQVLAEKKRKQEHEQTQPVQKKELEKQKSLEEQQRLQPAELASEEDVWISHGSQTPEKPLPSTSEQVLQPYASATSSGPSTLGAFRRQATPGTLLVAPSIAGADGSRDGYAQASADVTSAARGASVLDTPIPGPSSVGLTTSKEGASLQVPTLSNLLTRDKAADAESAAAAGASMLASVSTPAAAGLRVAPNSYLDPMREHPYAYLPSPIVERTPGPFVLNIKGAISSPPGRRNPVPLLDEVRRLFANRVLNLRQMKELRDLGHLLIGHAFYHQQDNLSGHQTYRMVHRLGIRFLVLDAVVSICIVLRQTPHADDWKAFVSAISHSPPPPTPRGMAHSRSSFFTSLVKELSMAIQTLKTGRRPSPSDLVRIKRMLFCSEYSPPRLKEEDFNGWRKDDGCTLRWH